MWTGDFQDPGAMSSMLEQELEELWRAVMVVVASRGCGGEARLEAAEVGDEDMVPGFGCDDDDAGDEEEEGCCGGDSCSWE